MALLGGLAPGTPLNHRYGLPAAAEVKNFLTPYEMIEVGNGFRQERKRVIQIGA